MKKLLYIATNEPDLISYRNKNWYLDGKHADVYIGSLRGYATCLAKKKIDSDILPKHLAGVSNVSDLDDLTRRMSKAVSKLKEEISVNLHHQITELYCNITLFFNRYDQCHNFSWIPQIYPNLHSMFVLTCGCSDPEATQTMKKQLCNTNIQIHLKHYLCVKRDKWNYTESETLAWDECVKNALTNANIPHSAIPCTETQKRLGRLK